MRRNRRIRRWGFLHEWRERAANISAVIVLGWVVLCVIQMLLTWGQMIPLRSEFMDGADRAECTRISWSEGLDCGGYYDDIVERRTALLHENGCILAGAWWIDGGYPDPITTWISGPVCILPFPLGSVVKLSGGSLFDNN